VNWFLGVEAARCGCCADESGAEDALHPRATLRSRVARRSTTAAAPTVTVASAA
jgi:hypothetical protein